MTEFMGLLQAQARGSRTTALQPLIYMASVLLAAGVLGHDRLPGWALVGVIGLAFLVVVVFISVYIHFVRSDLDALRSERFVIRKLEIQSKIGDSTTGILSRADSNNAASQLLGPNK
jgi:hypothetical protein